MATNHRYKQNRKSAMHNSRRRRLEFDSFSTVNAGASCCFVHRDTPPLTKPGEFNEYTPVATTSIPTGYSQSEVKLRRDLWGDYFPHRASAFPFSLPEFQRDSFGPSDPQDRVQKGFSIVDCSEIRRLSLCYRNGISKLSKKAIIALEAEDLPMSSWDVASYARRCNLPSPNLSTE
jgi:hypothetical protein